MHVEHLHPGEDIFYYPPRPDGSYGPSVTPPFPDRRPSESHLHLLQNLIRRLPPHPRSTPTTPPPSLSSHQERDDHCRSTSPVEMLYTPGIQGAASSEAVSVMFPTISITPVITATTYPNFPDNSRNPSSRLNAPYQMDSLPSVTSTDSTVYNTPPFPASVNDTQTTLPGTEYQIPTFIEPFRAPSFPASFLEMDGTVPTSLFSTDAPILHCQYNPQAVAVDVVVYHNILWGEGLPNNPITLGGYLYIYNPHWSNSHLGQVSERCRYTDEFEFIKWKSLLSGRIFDVMMMRGSLSAPSRKEISWNFLHSVTCGLRGHITRFYSPPSDNNLDDMEDVCSHNPEATEKIMSWWWCK